jgi:isopenicillin-N N-acyltransferase like protein
MRFFARHKKKLIAVVAVPLLLFAAHLTIGVATRMTAPAVSLFVGPPITTSDPIRRLDGSYTRLWGGVREVYLEGSPEQLGAAHGRLLYDHMVKNEGELWRIYKQASGSGTINSFTTACGTWIFLALLFWPTSP